MSIGECIIFKQLFFSSVKVSILFSISRHSSSAVGKFTEFFSFFFSSFLSLSLSLSFFFPPWISSHNGPHWQWVKKIKKCLNLSWIVFDTSNLAYTCPFNLYYRLPICTPLVATRWRIWQEGSFATSRLTTVLVISPGKGWGWGRPFCRLKLQSVVTRKFFCVFFS